MIDENQYIVNKLVENGLITLDQSKLVIKHCNEHKFSVLESVIDLNYASRKDVEDEMCNIFNITRADISTSSVDYSLLSKTTSVFTNERRIMPYRMSDGVIYAAIDNPLNIAAGLTLQTQFNMPVSLSLVSSTVLDEILKSVAFADRRQKAISELGQEDDKTSDIKSDSDKYLSTPAVSLANTLLEEAIAEGASDIHIEPMENEVRVRYRVDGVLAEHCRIALNLYQALLARYKIMAELDIAERRIPQDGKISMTFNGHEYDFRMSTLPLIYGEKIVIRIYNSLGDQMTVAKLASDKNDERKLRNLIQSPHGIILLTGPTGSGKTTTLYAFLKELNKPGVNIQTVEDPVENQVLGTNQLQVNTKTGLTFATALRSILRQDPNIIMIGEIRDEETAHIAVQAAITGHLVFSTIHTNDAITTVVRLMDMGIEPYLVSDSLVGAISQRLMRRLCPFCKKEHLVSEAEGKLLNLKAGSKIFEPCGCHRCNKTGYKGRVPVFEILAMGNHVRSAISQNKFGSEELSIAAKEDGLVPLKERAAALVKSGVTSIEEFNALISHVGD